jgi:hypothetical protein
VSVKIRISIWITAWYIAAGYFTASAQLVTQEKNQLPRNLAIQVKQLSEFIGRFNYEKDFLNRDIGPAFSSKISREQYMGLLFNNAADGKTAGKIIQDTLEANFINEVCRDSIFIDRYSELVYAELKCKVLLKGVSTNLFILAKQEVDHGLKWSFVSVQPELETAGEKYTSHCIQDDQPEYIPPLSNETNFIVLRKILTGKNNLGIYTANYHNPGSINNFYTAVGKGELIFDHVETITYYVFDIPGWIMIIRNFHRDTSNSGWLIDELERMNGDSYSYFMDKFGMSRIAFQK